MYSYYCAIIFTPVLWVICSTYTRVLQTWKDGYMCKNIFADINYNKSMSECYWMRFSASSSSSSSESTLSLLVHHSRCQFQLHPSTYDPWSNEPINNNHWIVLKVLGHLYQPLCPNFFEYWQAQVYRFKFTCLYVHILQLLHNLLGVPLLEFSPKEVFLQAC